MKKICTALFFLLVLNNAFGKGAFEAGDNIISGGINLGSTYSSTGYSNSAYGRGYNQSASIGFNAQFEHGIWEVGGPGVVSLGGYLGFMTFNYDYNDSYYGYYSYKRNYTIIGVRGTYHFDGLPLDNLDVYGGVMPTFNIVSYTYSGNRNSAFDDPYGSAPGLSAFVGAKYFFVPSVCVYLELGVGVSILSTGLGFKF